MKIKGTKKAIRFLEEIHEDIQKKIDNVDWEKNEDVASEKDERLNNAWDAVDEAINALKNIDNI